MSRRRGTLWKLDPHTVGKHIVLREYLKAWLPILGMTDRIVYIDAFAGPGEYVGGEKGSPLIALETFAQHPAAERMKEVTFLFIDEDSKRINHLRSLVEAFGDLPPNANVHSHAGEFAKTISELLDHLDSTGKTLAPTLLLVDPFGVKGIPMSLLQRVLRNPKSELLISFMSDWIERFGDSDEFAPHMNELFGTADWRECHGDENAYEALFARRLRAIGATHVLRFAVKSNGRHVYSLFFATRNKTGCAKMKDAMWKAAPDGSYTYEPRIATERALTLRFFEAPLERLAGEILGKLRRVGVVAYSDLVAFVESDKTIFRVSDLNKCLADLENRGRILVESPDPKRRKRQFRGTLIHAGHQQA